MIAPCVGAELLDCAVGVGRVAGGVEVDRVATFYGG